MSLIDELPDDGTDVMIPFQGFDVVVDPESASKMDGTSIDYLETPTESGFKIDNPLDNQAAKPRPSGAPENETDRALYEKIEALIESDINPSIASHGGYVNLIDVKDNTVYIEMAGGCQGCGMASVTLKHGIERVIRKELPEVQDILDVTDHAGGENPYYASSSK